MVASRQEVVAQLRSEKNMGSFRQGGDKIDTNVLGLESDQAMVKSFVYAQQFQEKDVDGNDSSRRSL
jgi:hypothetical protein